MQSYLEQASFYQSLIPPIIERARQLQSEGLKNFRCKTLALAVINPVDYILEIEDENLE
jgi:hypothetical protein